MCEKCDKPTQAIYGGIELANGLKLPWLLFVDSSLNVEAAKKEAIRIQSAWWRGAVVHCWTN